MSWQAQTAVNHHSKITDMKLFRLLLYLAECANDNGRIDPAPNQDTLAEFYGVSSRTIRNWLNALCDSGEVEQTRVGSGPGNPSAYQITLPMPDKGGNKAEENTGNVSAFESFMVEIKAEIDALKVEILALKVEKVEDKGGKGGNERRKAHSFKSADDPYDPSFDPNVYIHPEPDEIVELETALAIVAKETKWAKTDDEFNSAAYALRDENATPEQVKGFTEWWQKNGFYRGKPALSSIVSEWRNYAAGLSVKNGKVEKTFSLVDENGNPVEKVVLNV